MSLDPTTCYCALSARDRRFDGRFFVAVKTTGIYCRPICPARTPGASRCQFFTTAAEAERAGFRACFRCRPELAPGLSPIDSISRLVRAASGRIQNGYLNDHSIEDLAETLDVSTRHLRRAMEAEIGVSPVELAQSRRLALAKQLLHDTSLSISDVAHAAGFASLRRFNALIRERWGRPPSAVRRSPVGGGKTDGAISLRLECRPPLAWESLLGFLGARAIPGVELVQPGPRGSLYRRSALIDAVSGWVEVGPGPAPHALQARIALSLAPRLMEVVVRLRSLFDLDARPEAIHAHLRADAALRPLLLARPGLRLPGAFDGFELAVRAVLGQQISVAGATTLARRLVERFGASLVGAPPGIDRIFPSAQRLAACSLAELRSVGLTAARTRTVIALAQEVALDRLDLSGVSDDPERSVAELQRIPGIGPWTAHYIALRALRWPNAFPAEDLVIRRTLRVKTARQAERRATRWEPWRGYAAMHVWSNS